MWLVPGKQAPSQSVTTNVNPVEQKKSRMSQEEKENFIRKLGLMSKTFGDNKLQNVVVGYNWQEECSNCGGNRSNYTAWGYSWKYIVLR